MQLLVAAASAQPSAASKLTQIPAEFWIRMAIALVVLISVVIALRKIAKVNKVLLAVIVFVIGTVVGFNWIYERNEPAWATPAVQWLAGFFPTKGKRPGH
jgi:hypothetical protein